ncbi:MAG TPA: TIGR04282 family arsenosugar biosynthesis glycosyltransferase [Thermoanaerobaculia bacterium]
MFETMAPPPKRLLVFARLPERGAVKTRLASEIGDDRAFAVYSAMLRDALASIGDSKDDTEVEVLWAPTEAADGDALDQAFGRRAVAMQTGETLGDRLSMAFSERFFFQRTERIIAVGVDDPTIPRPLIDAAFNLLESCDWVVGPATDGGYYLIGCRGPAFESEAFQQIAWGTPSVFSTTVTKIRNWQRNLAILPMRSDIDTAEDLEAASWKP